MKSFLLLVLAGLLIAGCVSSKPGTSPLPPIVAPPAPEPMPSLNGTAPEIDQGESPEPPQLSPPPAQTVEVTMSADAFAFTPSTIRVKQGDTVKLTVTSKDKDHGIALPEFGVSQYLAVGETKVITFVADKKGTFEFRCSVPCGSGHESMRGQIIVE